MSLLEWLRGLLGEGRCVFTDPVEAAPAGDAKAAVLLERVFRGERRSVAGPPLLFDRESALAAARFLASAAWYLVSHRETDAEMEAHLVLPNPTTPSAHLSADLLLRYAPQIHRRACARASNDVLAGRLADALRRWPLSGVLGDLADGPLTDLDFGGHSGLLLLYAERLAEHFKPAWLPRGRGRSYVELVWTTLGRDVALLQELRAEAVAGQ